MCLCGQMVTLSLICSSPAAEARSQGDLYLSAAIAYGSGGQLPVIEEEETEYAAGSSAAPKSINDVLIEGSIDETEHEAGGSAVPANICEEVEGVIASQDRFPSVWPRRDIQEMRRQERCFEDALERSTDLANQELAENMHRAFLTAIPQLHGVLQHLPSPDGRLCCDTCKVAFDGPGRVLAPVQRRSRRGRLPQAWVFVGRTIFKAPVQILQCMSSTHSKINRHFRPRGVNWSRSTYLFNVQDNWFFCVSLLVEVTELVMETRTAPTTAIKYHLARSYKFMQVHTPDAATPLLLTAINQMYKAWYAYIWLVDDEESKFATCRHCGFFPKVGADACAKTLMNLSSASSRKQLKYPTTPPKRCDVCQQLLGSNGGWALKFTCGKKGYNGGAGARESHSVCFMCLPTASCQAFLTSHLVTKANSALQKSDTSDEDVTVSVAGIQGEVDKLHSTRADPRCPVCAQLATRAAPAQAAPTAATAPAAPISNKKEAEERVDNETEKRANDEPTTAGMPAMYSDGGSGPDCGDKTTEPSASPQVLAGPRLWTQRRLWEHCGRHILRICFHGGNPDLPPIPVEKVPPIFQAPETYASDTLFNSSQLKGQNSGYAAGGGLDPPTAAAIEPLRVLVASGELIPAALRENAGHDNADEVRAWLRQCGVPEAKSKAVSAAKGRDWLMRALDLLVQGKDDCKYFVSAAHGTGGTADFSCLHGVEICRKYLFEQESTRDYCDVLRSFRVWPSLFVIDASCGVVATMEANHPGEAKELWGEYHGTFKPFLSENQIVKEDRLPDLSRVSIPDFEPSAAQHYANTDASAAARRFARQAIAAEGKDRLKRHPLMLGSHRARAVVSDKWHQSPYVLKRSMDKKSKPHSHRKVSCTQHLLHICSSASRCRTSIMESLNARRKLHLATICTTDPVHHMIFTEKLRRFGNARIIEQQDKELLRSLGDEQEVIVDPDFGVARVIKSKTGHDLEMDVEMDVEQEMQSADTSSFRIVLSALDVRSDHLP